MPVIVIARFFKGLSDQPEETDAESARMYSVLIESGAFAIGQSLADLALCDIEVSAIRRHGSAVWNPVPRLVYKKAMSLCCSAISMQQRRPRPSCCKAFSDLTR